MITSRVIKNIKNLFFKEKVTMPEMNLFIKSSGLNRGNNCLIVQCVIYQKLVLGNDFFSCIQTTFYIGSVADCLKNFYFACFDIALVFIYHHIILVLIKNHGLCRDGW